MIDNNTENKWKIYSKTKNLYENIFIYIKSDSYRELKINPDLETRQISDRFKYKNTFKYFKNNKFFENFNTKEINIINNNLFNKNITDEIIYKIYYKKKINIDLKKLIFNNNLLYYYKLINIKKLNIIIYYFDNNIYAILSYYNINKIRCILVNTYIELLMYLYKLELDMKLIPNYSKIITYPLLFTNLLKYNELNIYFNNYMLYWK